MMENMYLTEMTIETKVREMARGAEERRVRSQIDVPPSRLRHAVASAIVRFGIFLNGSRYHCPEADRAMGARSTG